MELEIICSYPTNLPAWFFAGVLVGTGAVVALAVGTYFMRLLCD
jgi:hypothetical protein